eukprot:jgi/Ulvmu1/6598/UM003_0235.1
MQAGQAITWHELRTRVLCIVYYVLCIGSQLSSWSWGAGVVHWSWRTSERTAAARAQEPWEACASCAGQWGCSSGTAQCIWDVTYVVAFQYIQCIAVAEINAHCAVQCLQMSYGSSPRRGGDNRMECEP